MTTAMTDGYQSPSSNAAFPSLAYVVICILTTDIRHPTSVLWNLASVL